MRTRQGIVLGYNAQAMVSPVAADEGVTGMLDTASDVVDEPNDAARLTAMTRQAEEVSGAKVPMTLADAGYFAGRHVAELHQRGQQVVMPDMARPTNHPYHKDQFIYDEVSERNANAMGYPQGHFIVGRQSRGAKPTPMRQTSHSVEYWDAQPLSPRMNYLLTSGVLGPC